MNRQETHRIYFQRYTPPKSHLVAPSTSASTERSQKNNNNENNNSGSSSIIENNSTTTHNILSSPSIFMTAASTVGVASLFGFGSTSSSSTNENNNVTNGVDNKKAIVANQMNSHRRIPMHNSSLIMNNHDKSDNDEDYYYYDYDSDDSDSNDSSCNDGNSKNDTDDNGWKIYKSVTSSAAVRFTDNSTVTDITTLLRQRFGMVSSSSSSEKDVVSMNHSSSKNNNNRYYVGNNSNNRHNSSKREKMKRKNKVCDALVLVASFYQYSSSFSILDDPFYNQNDNTHSSSSSSINNIKQKINIVRTLKTFENPLVVRDAMISEINRRRRRRRRKQQTSQKESTNEKETSSDNNHSHNKCKTNNINKIIDTSEKKDDKILKMQKMLLDRQSRTRQKHLLQQQHNTSYNHHQQQQQSNNNSSNTTDGISFRWFFQPRLNRFQNINSDDENDNNMMSTGRNQQRKRRSKRRKERIPSALTTFLPLDGYCTGMESSIRSNDYDDDDGDENDIDEKEYKQKLCHTDDDDDEHSSYSNHFSYTLKYELSQVLSQQEEHMMYCRTQPIYHSVNANCNEHYISGYLLKQSTLDPNVWRRVYCVLTDSKFWYVSSSPEEEKLCDNNNNNNRRRRSNRTDDIHNHGCIHLSNTDRNSFFVSSGSNHSKRNKNNTDTIDMNATKEVIEKEEENTSCWCHSSYQKLLNLPPSLHSNCQTFQQYYQDTKTKSPLIITYAPIHIFQIVSLPPPSSTSSGHNTPPNNVLHTFCTPDPETQRFWYNSLKCRIKRLSQENQFMNFADLIIQDEEKARALRLQKHGVLDSFLLGTQAERNHHHQGQNEKDDPSLSISNNNGDLVQLQNTKEEVIASRRNQYELFQNNLHVWKHYQNPTASSNKESFSLSSKQAQGLHYQDFIRLCILVQQYREVCRHHHLRHGMDFDSYYSTNIMNNPFFMMKNNIIAEESHEDEKGTKNHMRILAAELEWKKILLTQWEAGATVCHSRSFTKLYSTPPVAATIKSATASSKGTSTKSSLTKVEEDQVPSSTKNNDDNDDEQLGEIAQNIEEFVHENLRELVNETNNKSTKMKKATDNNKTGGESTVTHSNRHDENQGNRVVSSSSSTIQPPPIDLFDLILNKIRFSID